MSFNHQTNTSGIGGIIRDHQGTSIQASATATVAASTLETELQAILRGARMCLDLNISDIIIEGDSFIIWNNINSKSGMPWKLMPLWKKLCHTLAHIPCWQVLLIRRSSNRLADALSKMGPPQEIMFTSNLPIHITDVYLQELCLQEERNLTPKAPHLENVFRVNATHILSSRNEGDQYLATTEVTEMQLAPCNEMRPMRPSFVSPFCLAKLHASPLALLRT